MPPRSYLVRAAVIDTIAIAVVAGMGAYYYARLPEQCASHFNLAGQPDGWVARQTFVIGNVVVTALFAAVLLASQWATTAGLRRLPAWLINIPHKHYWLAPERADATRRDAAAIMAPPLYAVGLIGAIFIVLLMQLAIEANLQPEPKLDNTRFYFCLAGLLLGVLIPSISMTIRLHRRFPRPPANQAAM